MYLYTRTPSVEQSNHRYHTLHPHHTHPTSTLIIAIAPTEVPIAEHRHARQMYGPV